ncbi:hypothetical protein HHI36_010267 [Cryptolaemus montrouzieri]|uniref:Uncharacterized protein n=1 Tax=Cryptolaemus montrouzieri TaxID=559131 RepID=A0ABD2MIZ7_9CUCU
MKEQCQEIELLQCKHDDFHMYKKVQDATGIFKNNKKCNFLVDENNEIITYELQVVESGETFIVLQLYDENRPENAHDKVCEDPSILRSELRHALNQTKCGKSAGVRSELLKLIGDENLGKLTSLFNKVNTQKLL